MAIDFAVGEFLVLLALGFFAQIVDGTLGMAFGVISTSAMLTIGFAPAQASALVHTAEVFTTGASAASHVYHGNVDWRLVIRLGIAGVLGFFSIMRDSLLGLSMIALTRSMSCSA